MLSSNFKRLVVAVLAACAIYGSAFALRNVPALQALADQAGDVHSLLFADRHAPGPGVPPFVYVDIDQQTNVALGRPVITPRNKLARAMAQIAAARPALVMLDVDVTWPGPREPAAELRAVLERLGRGDVPILLFRVPLSPDQPGLPPHFRPGPLDAIVAASSSLMWVSAAALDSGDRVARRAPLWFVGCRGNEPMVLPGAGVAAWAILRQGIEAARRQLEDGLSKAARTCATGGTAVGGRDAATAALTLNIKGKSWRLRNAAPDNGFTYSMGWKLPDGRRRPEVTAPGTPRLPTLTILPAGPFMQAKGRPVDPSLFKGAAVIIGSSAPDHRDIHLTPLGDMPGALIITNQIRSLIEHGPGRPNDFWYGLAVTIACTLITFIGWLGLKLMFPNLPPIIVQILTVAIAGLWSLALALLPGTSTAILYPLTQYAVIIVLMLAGPRSQAHNSKKAEIAKT